MAFLFGKLAFLVLRPSNLLLLLALLGVRGRAWRRGGGALVLAPPRFWHRRLHAAARRPVADHAAGGPLPAARRLSARMWTAIVVLGGGSMADMTGARGQPSFGATMERFAAIPELARRYPGRPHRCSPAVPPGTGAATAHRGRCRRPIPRAAGAARRAGDAGGSRPLDAGQRAAQPCRWPARGRASAGCWSPRPCTCRARSACSAAPAGPSCSPGRSTIAPPAAGSGRRAAHGRAAASSIRPLTSGTGSSTIGCWAIRMRYLPGRAA